MTAKAASMAKRLSVEGIAGLREAVALRASVTEADENAAGPVMVMLTQERHGSPAAAVQRPSTAPRSREEQHDTTLGKLWD
jgi:hypothetical protein